MPTAYTEIIGHSITTEHLHLFGICKIKHKLIVGLCKDEYNERYGIQPKHTYNERKKLLLSCSLVDKVIEQLDRSKLNAELTKNHIDIVFSSSIDGNMNPIQPFHHKMMHESIELSDQQIVPIQFNKPKFTCQLCQQSFMYTCFPSHIEYCIANKKRLSKSNRSIVRDTVIWKLLSLEHPEYEHYVALPATTTLIQFDTYIRDLWFNCCADHRSIFIQDGLIEFSENKEECYIALPDQEVEERSQHLSEKLFDFCMNYSNPGLFSFNPMVLLGNDEGELFEYIEDDNDNNESNNSKNEEEYDYEYEEFAGIEEIEHDTDDIIITSDYLVPLISYMSTRKHKQLSKYGEEGINCEIQKCIKNPGFKDSCGLYRYIPYIINGSMQYEFSMKTKIEQVRNRPLVYEYDEAYSSRISCTPIFRQDIKAPNKILPIGTIDEPEYRCYKCNKKAIFTNYFQELFWCNDCNTEEPGCKINNTPRSGHCAFFLKK